MDDRRELDPSTIPFTYSQVTIRFHYQFLPLPSELLYVFEPLVTFTRLLFWLQCHFFPSGWRGLVVLWLASLSLHELLSFDGSGILDRFGLFKG